MIEGVEISFDGPDGVWLHLDDDEHPARFRFRLTDEACAQLDKELQPWREHQAEGESVRQQFETHKATGYCTVWVPGRGACILDADHDGDHDPDGVGL